MDDWIIDLLNLKHNHVNKYKYPKFCKDSENKCGQNVHLVQVVFSSFQWAIITVNYNDDAKISLKMWDFHLKKHGFRNTRPFSLYSPFM